MCEFGAKNALLTFNPRSLFLLLNSYLPIALIAPGTLVLMRFGLGGGSRRRKDGLSFPQFSFEGLAGKQDWGKPLLIRDNLERRKTLSSSLQPS